MITIYGNTNCVWCDRAKELCDQYKLAYEYKSIQQKEFFAELQEQVPGVRTVPQIFWHNKHIGGYNELASEIENTRNYGDGQV